MFKRLLQNFRSNKAFGFKLRADRRRLVTPETAYAAQQISDAMLALSIGYLDLYLATGDEAAAELSRLSIDAAHTWNERAEAIRATLVAS